jgi:hypothetical protein
VVTLKVAEVAPAGTVTLVGTDATAGLALESGIVAPPAGAAELRPTVPVEGVPPGTLVGLRNREERVVAETTRLALLVTPSSVAEMFTAQGAQGSGVVEITKLALVAPAGTVTVVGTLATEGLLLERTTVMPPPGAGETSVTIPVEAAP